MATVEDRLKPHPSASSGFREACRTLVRKPNEILEGTRWLFTWLALLSLLFSLPGVAAVATVNPVALFLAAAATVTLWASWIYCFLLRRVPIGLEVLDAIAITAFALAGPSTAALIPTFFAAAWLRTLYGNRWRSVARGTLYTGILLAVTVLWPLVPEHTTVPDPIRQLGIVSITLLTIAVAGQLRVELQAHDWAIERDQALTQAGAELLSLTDPERIRRLGWSTANELLATTPGLRILKVVRDGQHLRVGPSIGRYAPGLPVVLPGTVVSSGEAAQASIGNAAPLDDAVGSALAWTCVPLTEDLDDAWLLVGAPKRLPESTLVSVWGLMNQVNLALRNSDAHRQLTEQASNDALTGLDNRPTFTSKLSTELAQRPSNSLHVLFLDLDDFKDVNDQLGHRAGDMVLTEVAHRLRQHLRPQDICARLGGDEFAVALTQTTENTASAIAHRMVASLASPFIVNGNPVRVGASAGVASATPGIDIDELVHQADVAMYAAKAAGKGQVKAFTAGLLESDMSLISFERQLNGAAGRGEIVVHYQPIVSLTDLRCTGGEALVRWQHPERGLLLPGEFVALAESSGSILNIGAHVLRQACADAATWPETRPGVPMTVDVNISARELESEHFADSVIDALQDSGLAPANLVLELTEPAILESDAAVNRIKALADHGIRIALDDFGTGYSSLLALRSLPISIVKLDASFVAGALHNPVDHAVVKSIVQMSAELNIITIAEGVETPAQQDLLAQIGTDAGQGFLYSPGMQAEEFRDWMHRSGGTEIY